jgi:hypothetical protein
MSLFAPLARLSWPATWARLPAALAGHAVAVALAGVLLLAIVACGRPARRWVEAARGPRGGGLLLGFVAGAAALSLILLGLGLAGLWFRGLYAVVIVSAAAAALPSCVAGLRGFRGVRPPAPALILLAATAAVVLPAAFVPETGTDCLIYHLAAPEQFLAVHRIHRDRLAQPFKLPLPAEMLFGWAVVCGHDAVAKLASACAGVLAAAAVAPVAGLPAWSPAAWIAAALLLASSRVLFHLPLSKPDLLALAAFAAALLAAGRRRHAVAWLAFGFAVSLKYTFLLAAPALLAWPWLVSGRGFRSVARAALPAWMAALPLLPWWFRNWLTFGNPLYFVLAGFFPTLDWPPGSTGILSACGIEVFAGRGTGTWPGAAVWGAGRFLAASPGLAAAVLLVFIIGAPLASRRLLGISLLLQAVFIRLGRVDRFCVPADYLAALSAALALAHAFGRLAPRWRRVAAGAIALAGAVPVAASFRALATVDPLPFLAGSETRRSYLARLTGELAGAQDAVAAARPRILLLASDQRAFRFRCRVVLSTAIGPPPLGWTLAREARNPAELAKRFRQLGLTHVAYNLVTAGFQRDIHDYFPWNDRMVSAYAAFCRTRLRIVRAPAFSDHPNGAFYLYEILPRPAAASRLTFFYPGAEGLFRKAWRAQSFKGAPAVDREYARLFRLVPDLQRARDDYAWVKMDREEHAAAFDLVRPGCLAGMIDDENWITYGVGALRLGRRAEALAAFRRAHDLYPDRRAGIGKALRILERGGAAADVR